MNFIDYLNELVKKTSSTKTETSGKSLEDQIREIETEGVLPDKTEVNPNTPYERLNYDAPTDEQIESDASKTVEAERKLKESALETEIEALYKQFESDKASGSANYETVRSAIDEAYAKAVSAQENDLLKRGLARSSAAANSMSQIEQSKASSQSAAANEYAQLMNKLDSEIAGLETKRQKAFADFDVTYTLKLTEQIQALKAERDAKQAEAAKYNNTLTEKEYKEELDRQKLESGLYTEALEQTKAEQSIYKNQSQADINRQNEKIYHLLREHLSGMSADDAKFAVRNSPLYADHLDNSYYYMLYEEFGR